ncbi:MAG: AbrB/MazE/SpoVT family DNA-binding domain-containing protein [Fidelibacterota bacterium]
MKIKVIKIGNSKGVRIPKPFLEQCGIEDEIEINVENENIIIHSPVNTRENWSVQFQAMAENVDDTLFISDSLENDFDADDWDW